MKRFNMIQEEFICENCGARVKNLDYTARDHCPQCLYSKHVDIMPGDRANPCKGLLKPIDIEKNKKADYKIIYRCVKCGEIHKNISAKDDAFEEILKIMSNKQ